MTWSRFDDAARKHPKAAKAGNDAWGFWAAAVMYCNQFQTDGFIGDSALSDVPPCPIPARKAKELADRLCRARMTSDGPGLFERDDQRGGYVVHDFLQWNPSKADTEAKRTRDRIRKMSARTNGGIREDSTRTPIGIQPESKRIPSHARECAPAPAGVGRAGISGSGSPEGVQGEIQPANHSAQDVANADRELPIPATLAETFPAYAEMARALKVTEGQLRSAAAEFQSYWTVGAGAGQRRQHWAKRLREWLRKRAHEGKLPPASEKPAEPTEPAFVPLTIAELQARNEAERQELERDRLRALRSAKDAQGGPDPKNAPRPPMPVRKPQTPAEAVAALAAAFGGSGST